jgi:CheY-like chemotaxis protein
MWNTAPVVVLAENDRRTRTRLTTLLHKRGFATRTASDDFELRQLVAGPIPDLLVISAEFDRESAGDWMAELSRCPRWSQVPIITTTIRPFSIFANALRQSATPVVAKPIDPLALSEALTAVGLATPRLSGPKAPDSRSILVVDDDAHIRHSLLEALRDEGYQVAAVDNGRTALEFLATHSPSLVLLDLMMPVVTGWDVCATMRASESLREIPICILSAHSQAQAPEGVVSFLEKPIGLERLLHTVAQHC